MVTKPNANPAINESERGSMDYPAGKRKASATGLLTTDAWTEPLPAMSAQYSKREPACVK